MESNLVRGHHTHRAAEFHGNVITLCQLVIYLIGFFFGHQLESTPTLGSFESSNYEKQMFAQKSLAFNLRNSNFCELFPDIVSEIKQRLQGTQAAAAASKSGSSGSKAIANGKANGSAVAEDNHNNKNANIANGQAALPADACGVDGAGAGAVAGAVANGDLGGIGGVGGSGAAALKNCARNSYLNWQSIYSNLVIIICFAIFALIVNYVIKNLNQE